MAQADGEVHALGDGAGGESRLRDRTTGQRSGGGDRGRHSCNARPLVGTRIRGRMGVSPHLRAECVQ